MYPSSPQSGSTYSSSAANRKLRHQRTIVYLPPAKAMDMKFVVKISNFISRRFVILSVLLGAMSWLLESVIHSQIFYEKHLDFVTSLLLPDKHELWMRCSIVVLFISFGFYAQRIVKALRETRETVTKMNMELTQIFDTAADGMRVIDKDFNILRVNSTFLDLVGVKKRDAVGKKCFEVFEGGSCHSGNCPMVRIRQGEGRVEYDAVKIRRDGRAIPCIVTATPFYDSNFEFIGIVEDFKDISERKKSEQELRHSHAKLRQVTSHLEMVREQERRTISREIHDELGQSLTGLKMDIHWLIRNHNRAIEPIDEKLHELDQQLNTTISTVQRISSEIRPGVLDDLGLQAAIEAEAYKVGDRLGIDFDIVCEPEDLELCDDCRIAVFRIFKEALTNIVRHSGASLVAIMLRQQEDQVILTVTDNGRGITQEQLAADNSLGLSSMQERAWLLDGFLQIYGEPGKGTTIFLSIPYRNEDMSLC